MFTVLIAIVVPAVLVYMLHHKWQPKKHHPFILTSIAIFVVLFLVVAVPLMIYFTPPCDEIDPNCVPFEYYPTNGSCSYKYRIFEDPILCAQLQDQPQGDCPRGTVVPFLSLK